MLKVCVLNVPQIIGKCPAHYRPVVWYCDDSGIPSGKEDRIIVQFSSLVVTYCV